MASPAASRPLKIPSLLLAVTGFCATLTSAQSGATVLDSSQLPSCASECDTLTNANGACVPPQAPETDQGTYQSCFCSSTLLTALYSTPQGIECSSCSGDDMGDIQQWYVDLCTGGTVVTPSAASGESTATETGGSSPTSTDSESQDTSEANNDDAAAGTSDSSVSRGGGNNQSWIDGHWQWVLLLIILFLAFVFFLTFGFWLKRRHRRKQELRLTGADDPRHAVGPSPFASGTLPYVGAGGGNHPQMTVVPGAGNDAAMARYDGSGVGQSNSGVGGAAIGTNSRRNSTRRNSLVRRSSMSSNRRSRAMSSLSAHGPYPETATAPYVSQHNMSRDFSVPNPPPLAAMREDSGDSRDSHKRRMRPTLRPAPSEHEDFESPEAESSRSRSSESREPDNSNNSRNETWR